MSATQERRERNMKKSNVKEVGPISVRVVNKKEVELFQTDLSWKYSIPFFGTPLELSGYLHSLANWLERYDASPEWLKQNPEGDTHEQR